MIVPGRQKRKSQKVDQKPKKVCRMFYFSLNCFGRINEIIKSIYANMLLYFIMLLKKVRVTNVNM